MIVVSQRSRGWQHNYSTKTRQAGCANKQCMYSLMFMASIGSKHAMYLYFFEAKFSNLNLNTLAKQI
jgi:hypothetical protein